MRWGIALGSAMSSGVDTYLKLSQMMHQQDEWDRENKARADVANDPGNTPQDVTPGALADQFKGADGKADPDAVMGTYGAMQGATPAQAGGIMAQGGQQAQQANQAAAQPTTFNLTNPNYQPPPPVAAPAAPTAAGIPGSTSTGTPGVPPLPGGPAPAASLGQGEDTMPLPPANPGDKAGGLGPGESVVNLPPVPAQAAKPTPPIPAQVNALGTRETPPDAPTPVDPNSKIIPVKATPISGNGITGNSFTFTKNADGEMVMQKAESAADKLTKLANAYYKNGLLDKFGPTMQAAMQIRSQEMTQQVSNIMMDPHSSADDKVGALSHLAGVQAFKTEQGNYLVPGLGPHDANGNPVPLTLGQVGSLAASLTTPEGMHHLMDMQNQQDELGIKKQTATAAMMTAQAAQAKIPIDKQNADTAQRKGADWADVYQQNAKANADVKASQADKAEQEAQISQKRQQLSDEMEALQKQFANKEIDAPTFKAAREGIISRDALLQSRLGNFAAPPKAPPEKPMDIADGQTKDFGTDADGNRVVKVYNGSAGTYLPPDVDRQVRDMDAQLKTSGQDAAGELMVSGQNGQLGYKIKPGVAAEVGLPTTSLYPSITAAKQALVSAKIKHGGANAPVGGLPMMNEPGVPGLLNPGL